ncbi:HTTM domain-containing protein [Neorhodopirellula pilleata]|uniref:HTTM-like domain-containing protein n=1 Tax=Neorhodopirellula pilleata TaxID=2714738 RepID=A0A5C6AVA1_9BACT|nr:HTTM domain-containing protein [Neorhodopirellula pilleata]TWU03670.1 hypothetical protein Pla100_06000 [Neorhodopirellula pilleata]
MFKKMIGNWFADAVQTWDRFWFTPRHVETLAVLRILTGAMLLYSHVVLATDLESFIGPDAWINNETAAALHDGSFGEGTSAWSYLWNIDSNAVVWVHHCIAIAVSAAFMVGFLTRITGPLAWFLQLMVIHRLIGSLFGLDQIVTYCAMYLAWTPCGAVFSIDAWIRERRVDDGAESSGRWKNWLFPNDQPSVSANVATRLLQLHLCVIYLFGGLAKARGQLWWDGTALWFAVGNYEYQSWDVTFLSDYPSVFTALTHLTLMWEVFYCALIWPKLTRPITLGLAVAVHGGIALFLGMMTFGTMMIAANGIFLSPWLFRRLRGFSPPHDAEIAMPTSPKSTANHSDLHKRLDELEKAETAFKKRYVKLKKREAKVQERDERLKATKAKLRQKLQDGTLSINDSHLDQLGSESGLHLDHDPDEEGSAIDMNLSDRDLLE